MKKITSIRLYTKLSTKMTIFQNLIETFILCKKQLIVHTLSIEIKAIVNFYQKNLGTFPPIPIMHYN